MISNRNKVFQAMFILAVAMLLAVLCFAAEGLSTFVRFQFGNDVTIEVPRNWTFLNKNIQQNLNTYSEAVVKFAGIDANQGNNQILVAANAYTNNKKPSATIRLSVRLGVFPDQKEIINADLNELRREAETSLMKLKRSLPENVKRVKLLNVRLERIGAYYAVAYDKEIDYVSGPAMDRLDVIYGSSGFRILLN